MTTVVVACVAGFAAGAVATVVLGPLVHTARRKKRRLEEAIAAADARAEEVSAMVARVEASADRLVEELDRRAERLEGIVARAERLATAAGSEAAREAGAAVETSTEERARGPGAGADRLRASLERDADGAEAGEDGTQSQIEVIYELADRGLDAVEIARATERQVGEVELVLGLRARRKSPPVQDRG